VILLLGGTSETAPLALALARAGRKVLVSTATEAALALPPHPLVSRRCGRLDAAGLLALLRDAGAMGVVDATHPYAVEAQANANEAARAAGVPYVRWGREATDAAALRDAIVAGGHDEAARAAFAFGCDVLLTIGSRHLAPYVAEARRSGRRVVARVLPLAESLEDCRGAGLPDSAILAARGPFSVEQNRQAIRNAAAGVVVTKDGGVAGGVPEKVEAARLEDCRLVVVRRPASGADLAVHTMEDLIRMLAAWGGGRGCVRELHRDRPEPR
jgi:precorrin-6A/cobalt-precorrin-6A reductase